MLSGPCERSRTAKACVVTGVPQRIEQDWHQNIVQESWHGNWDLRSSLLSVFTRIQTSRITIPSKQGKC